jgi:heme-degrading monooxygenase HmoA
MFVHLAVHRPRPEKTDLLVESMRRFGAAMRGRPGLRDAFVLRGEDEGVLVGLALWASRADWEAARPAMAEAVKDDPFDEWEDEPPLVFRLDEV